LTRRPINSAAAPHGRTAAASLEQNDPGATNGPEIGSRATGSAPDRTSQVSDRLAVLAELSLAGLRLEWRRLFRADPGAALGLLVSISSVGAGAIGVTALLMLYPKLPIVRIVASDIAHAVPLTLIAGAGHWWIGSIDWALLVSLLIGSVPGIAISSHFASRVPDSVLRPALAGTLALVGARLAL
jgi:uncharacterized membrane protein YfcA